MRQLFVVSVLVMSACSSSGEPSPATSGVDDVPATVEPSLGLANGMSDPPAPARGDVDAAVELLGRDDVDPSEVAGYIEGLCETAESFGGALGLANAGDDQIDTALSIACPAQYEYMQQVAAVGE